MNRGFVFILILAVGLVVTSCLRQGKQNVTYDFTPLENIELILLFIWKIVFKK